MLGLLTLIGPVKKGCARAIAAGLLTAFLLPIALPGALAEGIENPWELCRFESARMEQVSGIPAQLLAAIARVESGRRDERTREISAWPWAVMAEGKGRYLPSKAEAVAEVRRLRARGVTNIDVGCMQINLRYHGEAFRSLEEAFDPLSNVAYAAAFLNDLRQETRSWTKAVGHYHSRDRERGLRYRRKVREAWREERRRAKNLAREERRLRAQTVAQSAPRS
jgi:hypothetical protein